MRLTLHLDKVQLVDGLLEGSAVQGQVEVAGHPRGEGSLPPLTLRHVDPPDQSVGDLRRGRDKTHPSSLTSRHILSSKNVKTLRENVNKNRQTQNRTL